ncbi:MAG: hemerythrin domain-containing protein [Sterolibacterium sp.]|jgi:hemerythrin-like domain-containing protein|nr:hemerythrin domain-containing protein [Sterolibacterium sp.]MBP9798600.1 hemerythrin domain-containing protein [Sterolibacterium sp.]
MSEIRLVLPPHHHHCDNLFSAAEEAAQKGDWPSCETHQRQFAGQLEAHLTAEEEVLFPAFENATGMRQGPTQVMRMEHGQMRALVGQMEAALAARDGEGYAGAAETLLILMQQHNMKEENILYPMCDQSLAGQVEAIAAELARRLAH